MRRRDQGLLEASVIVQIPFHDIDAMEIAWHGHYAKYFEIARGALLTKIGYNYREMKESGFAWPVIEMKIRYAQPARFGQRVNVRASLLEYEMRLKIGYLITDVDTGRRLTRGHTVQVAVDMASEELLFASPPILLEKLEQAK